MFYFKMARSGIFLQLTFFYRVEVSQWPKDISDHEVPGSNPTGGGIQLMIVRRFSAQSISLSLFHRLDVT